LLYWPRPGCTLLCFHSVNCLSALPSVKTSVYLQSVLTEKLKSTTSRPPSQSLTCAAMNVPLTTVPPTLLNPISLLLLAKTAPSASGYIYYSSVLYKPSFFQDYRVPSSTICISTQHRSSVSSTCFLDNNSIISSSEDKTVRIFGKLIVINSKSLENYRLSQKSSDRTGVCRLRRQSS
jgi:hypothetical protein